MTGYYQKHYVCGGKGCSDCMDTGLNRNAVIRPNMADASTREGEGVDGTTPQAAGAVGLKTSASINHADYVGEKL